MKFSSMLSAFAAAVTFVGVATLAQAGPDQMGQGLTQMATFKMSPIRNRPVHICPPGYSWQLGCLIYSPKQPGQLFSACRWHTPGAYGYGCFRNAGPIQ